MTEFDKAAEDVVVTMGKITAVVVLITFLLGILDMLGIVHIRGSVSASEPTAAQTLPDPDDGAAEGFLPEALIP